MRGRPTSRLSLPAALAAVLLLAAGCDRAADDTQARKIEADPSFTRAAAIERYFTDREPAPIEGIWLEQGGDFEIALVQNRTGWRADWPFAGLVINAKDPAWKPGTPRLYFKTPGLGGAVEGWIGGEAVTFIAQGPNVLDTTLPNPFGIPKRLRLLRAYPEVAHTPPTLRPPANAETKRKRGGYGTGFFVAGDIVATNEHVVSTGKTVRFDYGSEKIEAETIRFDGRLDIALLRIKSKPVRPTTCLSLGRTNDVEQGEKVFALGHPTPTQLSTDLKVSEGIVNAPRGVRNDSTRLQHSTPVQPGNSGSPLLDDLGRVIGVVVSRVDYAADGRPAQNVNFAVKVRFLREMLATVQGEPCGRTAGASPVALDARHIVERYGDAVVRLHVED